MDLFIGIVVVVAFIVGGIFLAKRKRKTTPSKGAPAPPPAPPENPTYRYENKQLKKD